MVKTPFVRLYSLIPQAKGGYKAVVLLYEGKDIAEDHLLQFSYTYEASGGDKGYLSLAFDSFKTSIAPFYRGALLSLEWGYRGGRTVSQQVSVNKLHVNYSAKGMVIKMEFVSISEFKAKHPAVARTVGGMLKENGIGIVYSFQDPVTHRVYEYSYYPRSGIKGWSVQWDDTMKKAEKSQREDIESKKKAADYSSRRDKALAEKNKLNCICPGEVPGASSAIDPLLATCPPLICAKLRKDYIQFEMIRERYGQSLQQLILESMTKVANDFLVTNRDNSVVVSTDVSKKAPLLSISTKGYISITYQELPKKLATSYVSSIKVDPKDGRVHFDTAIIKGEYYETIESGKGKDKKILAKYPIVKQNGEYGFNLKTKKAGKFFFKLPPAQKAAFEEYREELKKDQSLAKSREREGPGILASPSTQHWHSFAPPRYTIGESTGQAERDRFNREHLAMGGSNLPHYGGRTPSWAREVKPQDLGPQDSHLPVTWRLVGGSLEENRNRLIQDALVNYFIATGVKVSLEGSTLYTGNFNFSMSGFSKELTGLYVTLQATHSISFGKYTVNLLGGKIPPNITTKYKQVTKEEDKVHQRLEEQYMVDETAIQAINATINDHKESSNWDLAPIWDSEEATYHYDFNYSGPFDSGPSLELKSMSPKDTPSQTFPNGLNVIGQSDLKEK